jgi:hypothetical protein
MRDPKFVTMAVWKVTRKMMYEIQKRQKKTSPGKKCEDLAEIMHRNVSNDRILKD